MTGLKDFPKSILVLMEYHLDQLVEVAYQMDRLKSLTVENTLTLHKP